MKLMEPPKGFRMREAYASDVDYFTPRAEDLREWYVSGAGKFYPELAASLNRAYHKFALYTEGDGNPEIILGVERSTRSPIPVIWMVASDVAAKRWMEAARPFLRWFNEVLTVDYPYLQCWASEENAVHLKWLEWLGFKKTGADYKGLEGVRLIHFVRGTP